MYVREKLLEMLGCCSIEESITIEPVAESRLVDYLITHGVMVQEWISVDDRLPENDVMVIGYTPCDGFMFVGYYHEEPKYGWKVWRIVTAMRSTKVMTKKVTHWMPLPQPPKGECSNELSDR